MPLYPSVPETVTEPPEIVRSPVKVLLPESVRAPVLSFTREPAPLTAPDRVWFAELLNFRVPALAVSPA